MSIEFKDIILASVFHQHIRDFPFTFLRYGKYNENNYWDKLGFNFYIIGNEEKLNNFINMISPLQIR